ncbi:unnamed protein product, partial [Anisakis simplex]|uniref:Uncharacterized protein n=1 Tax=Anisakis simplex TaxID=6269 RepID=A0A0M3KKJ4_ANISI
MSLLLYSVISRPVREKDKSKKYAEIRGDSSDSDDESEAPRVSNAASEQQVNLPGTPGFYVDWLVDMLSGYILREVEIVLQETTG